MESRPTAVLFLGIAVLTVSGLAIHSCSSSKPQPAATDKEAWALLNWEPVQVPDRLGEDVAGNPADRIGLRLLLLAPHLSFLRDALGGERESLTQAPSELAILIPEDAVPSLMRRMMRGEASEMPHALVFANDLSWLPPDALPESGALALAITAQGTVTHAARWNEQLNEDFPSWITAFASEER